jgi:hypothetical protein
MGLNGEIELSCVLQEEVIVICVTKGFRKTIWTETVVLANDSLWDIANFYRMVWS